MGIDIESKSKALYYKGEEGVRHRYSNFYTESVKVFFGITPEL